MPSSPTIPSDDPLAGRENRCTDRLRGPGVVSIPKTIEGHPRTTTARFEAVRKQGRQAAAIQ